MMWFSLTRNRAHLLKGWASAPWQVEPQSLLWVIAFFEHFGCLVRVANSFIIPDQNKSSWSFDVADKESITWQWPWAWIEGNEIGDTNRIELFSKSNECLWNIYWIRGNLASLRHSSFEAISATISEYTSIRPCCWASSLASCVLVQPFHKVQVWNKVRLSWPHFQQTAPQIKTKCYNVNPTIGATLEVLRQICISCNFSSVL